MKARYIICTIISLLLTACGFHLRGFVTDIHPQFDNIAISIQNAHRDLELLLKDGLLTYGISVTDPTHASYLLVVEQDSKHQQITNVAASTAPRQYLISYDVQFTLIKVKGPVLIPSSHVMVSRQLTINNNRILGSNYEEAVFYSEMRRDAAIQIINRLSHR